MTMGELMSLLLLLSKIHFNSCNTTGFVLVFCTFLLSCDRVAVSTVLMWI